MATSKQIIDAARDADLKERLTALAAAEGIDDPEHWVTRRLSELVGIDLNGVEVGDDSIASVYEYAKSQYVPAPTPGGSPAFVTDIHIRTAIQQVRAREAATA